MLPLKGINMNKLFVPFLPPWVETGLQPAFYDKESGTVLQQTARMYDKVNQLIRNFNDLSKETKETIEEYILKFTELKDFVDDYFDNLDVQEEINNKLDEMTDEGTLQEIITAYIQANVAWSFDTVADMKVAENFINGSYAQTLGYHSKNDGGSALYKVRTITNDDVVDDKFIIELADDSLIAELIIVDKINVKQLGAYGDDTHNDTDAFKSALGKTNCSIFVPSGTYLIDDKLTVGTYTTIEGNDSSSVIKCNANLGTDYIFNVPYSSRFCTIKNLKIDAMHLANGIYDGYGTPVLATRLNILNLTIENCKTSLYLNSVGSTVDNCYIIGEYTLDNTGRDQYGIYIDSTDNMISDTRVACFTQYAIYCNKASNKFSNVKCMLSGTGCYLKGENISGVMEAQENFHDNFKLYRVYDSNLTLNTSGAGIVEKVGDTIPTTLNNYSLIDIEECKSTIIAMAGGIREVYGDTWSCEGNVITMSKSIGMDINANCYTHTDSTATPKMINADTITGNNVIVNGFKYFNNLKKTSVTLQGYSNNTLNYQDGDNFDCSIAGGATGNIAFMHFAYNNWNNLSLFIAMSEGVSISQISFRYTVNGTGYSIQLSSNTVRDITAGCSMYRIVQDIATTLSNNAQYQTFISQGETIENKEIQIQANLNNSVISNRNNIKGLIEIYTS